MAKDTLKIGTLSREMDIKLNNLPQCINLNSSELDKYLRLEKEFQPPIENNYKVHNNESGGVVTRQIYGKYFE